MVLNFNEIIAYYYIKKPAILLIKIAEIAGKIPCYFKDLLLKIRAQLAGGLRLWNVTLKTLALVMCQQICT